MRKQLLDFLTEHVQMSQMRLLMESGLVNSDLG